MASDKLPSTMEIYYCAVVLTVSYHNLALKEE
jgi:hypothetical protein